MMMMVMEPQGCETTDGWGGWGLVMSCGRGGRRRSGTQGPEETRTYETFSGLPRLRCAPASPRCPLASESTGARCPVGSRGPARWERREVRTTFVRYSVVLLRCLELLFNGFRQVNFKGCSGTTPFVVPLLREHL